MLRIRADDPNAVCQLGIKFGCSLGDGRELLNTAKELGLNVVGVRYDAVCIFFFNTGTCDLAVMICMTCPQ